MKQETTYGKEAAKHAKVLISQGWTNEEIKAVHVCRNIPFDALRRWRFRMKPKNETVDTFQETAETAQQMETSEQEQNPITDAENNVSGISKTYQSVSFAREFAQSFHPADLVFYGVIAIGCAGVSGALPGIGIAVSSVWFSVAALYLHRVKMYARWFDIALLAIFEVLAGFVADWVWANNALWANIHNLPFKVYIEKYQNGAGELVAFYAGPDVELPAYIACYIAAMLVVFGGAAVAVSALATQNSITNQK